jgi:hypothetical protein
MSTAKNVEEMANTYASDKDDCCIGSFKAGHAARDEEVEQLKRIISGDHGENDEIGAEFTIAHILREEICKLQSQLSEAHEVILEVSKYGPPHGTMKASTACVCDMGGAGYASRGDGFHDDDCAIKDAQLYLEKYGVKKL